MSGSLSRADLVADLKASLQDAAKVFTAINDADFNRHLDTAAQDMTCKRPRTMLGMLTLAADQFNYPAPADFFDFKSSLWGVSTQRVQPWDKRHPGRLPDVRSAMNGLTRELHLLPAPSGLQINVLGASFKFYYYAAHSIGTLATDTTIQAGDRDLLLLRAQAEAMKEMAMRNISKPVAMRDGLSQGPRNGTPQYLFEQLMKLFQEAA
ncbi:MAG: hypothetical protein WC208_09630 [Gallionella sp.]|jgi:hypothetical protein